MSPNVNIFALHFFLYSGSLTPIYNYVSVYAEHYANASSSQYGLLNMILPFATIVTNVLVCSAADRHQTHRKFFIGSMLISLATYGSYAALPFVIERQPDQTQLNLLAWLLICIITTASTLTIGVMTCLGDTLAMHSAKLRQSSFGKIRVWGTIGWGSISLVLASMSRWNTRLPLMVPGLLVSVALIVLDLVATTLWPERKDFTLECQPTENVVMTNEKQEELCDRSQVHISSIGAQFKLFMEVARRRKSIFLYLILFLLSGALISLQWSYFFLYLKRIYDGRFEYVSSFTMVLDSLSELPSLLFSDRIIRMLGRDHTLGITFILMGARFLLYTYLVPRFGMLALIVPELLHGPMFGLFVVVLTEVANDYAECEDAIVEVIKEGLVPHNADSVQKLRQALRATMQSLCYTCYEGIGLGIGSIVGGLVVQYLGFESLWFYAAAISIAVGLITCLTALRYSIKLKKRSRDNNQIQIIV